MFFQFSLNRRNLLTWQPAGADDMRFGFGRLVLGVCLTLWSLCEVGPVFALEKYGRPLPALEQEHTEPEESAIDRSEEETLIGGYFLTSAFVTNPSFTARPDNTGLVGMRHMLHLETDLYKQYLTFYTDQNFMSDRQTGWIKLSEWDDTYGLTGIVDHYGWRVQYERDKPLDRSGLQQIYADTLVTYRFRASDDLAWWSKLLPKQELSAYAGPGWMFYNHNYFARPDNTGTTLFRYVGHFDLELYGDRAIFFGDFNMFTDRTARSVIRPSELDWILGLAGRWHDYELSVYREQDRPLDRSGFVQQYTAIQFRMAFDFSKKMFKKLLGRQ